jgi:hypothetical protein
MQYVVKVNPSVASDGKASFGVRTRKEAVLKAVALIGQGCNNVTITDETGKVFESGQFSIFFKEGDE